MEERPCNKIRKRGCSSSSSSSLVRKYRFKRAISVGKRAGSGTPQMGSLGRSPVSTEGAELKFPARNIRDNGVVSARRLAASLWEINEVASPLGIKEIGDVVGECSDPVRSTIPKKCTRSGNSGHRRRKSAPDTQKLLTTLQGSQLDDLLINENLLPVEGRRRSGRVQFGDVSKGIVTAKELVKVLSHVWRLEEKHSSSAKSIVSALKVELDRASSRVDQLGQDERAKRREMRYVVQNLEEERVLYRGKMSRELEAERRLRRQAERMNKRLGRELGEVKGRLEEAVRELESERRAKEVLEQVCDELAKGIGEDREEVEELKRASEKAWEEVEKEREMLQLADVLREERVQMKLAEAKYHFEEKNADIEKLKSELEAYMCNGGVVMREEDGEDGGVVNESPGSANSEVLREFLRKTLGKVCQNPNIEAEDAEVDDGEECEDREEDSGESDLHSIELEAEDNRKTFKWGYSPPTSGHDDSKRSSVEVFKGRKSLSEKIQWATISLLKGGSTVKDDTAAAAAPQKDEASEGMEKRRSSASSTHSRSSRNIKDQEVEIKKHKSIKSLKKHILSSFKLGSSHGSPAKQWGQAIERS